MPAATSGALTRSEIEAWDTTHLETAATHWRSTAAHWESHYETIHTGMLRPGGTAWDGTAADAAAERSWADLVKVRGAGDALYAAAGHATNGAGDIAWAKRQVLEAITEAEEAGFTVGQDFSVTDKSSGGPLQSSMARQQQAQGFAAEISTRVQALAALDKQVASRITTALAPLEGLQFGDTPDHNGTVQAVDLHQFKDSPSDLNQLSPNRRAAVEFAEKNAKGYGNILERKWYNEQDNDCTNFVSNALNAGGFKDDDPFHTNTRTEDRWFPYSMKGSPSAAWDRADGLYNYIKNGYGKASGGPVGTEIGSVTLDPTKGTFDPNYLTKIGMKPGDIIVYDWNGGEGISHSAMYVGPQSLSDVANASGDAVDYHSNNTAHHSWALPATKDGQVIPHQVTYRFIHIQYPGEQQ